MKILRLICDCCHREEIEDDANGWAELDDGRDLCAVCAGAVA